MTESRDIVLPKYFLLDREQGGRNAILMGAPGEGKTSLLQYLTYLACRGKDIYGKSRQPQECIWRARKHDKYLEFFNLGIGKLMLPEGSDYSLLKVYDDDREQEITLDDLEDEGIDYALYDGSQDIIRNLEEGKVLCILYPGSGIEETSFYADLFSQLVDRKSRKWIHICIDEADDILGPYSSDSYKVQQKFINSASDFRKTMVNSVFATHDYRNLDYRLLPKTKWHMYKKGAKRMQGEPTKLKQDYINALQLEEAELVFGAFFDKFTYPPMKKENRLDYKLQTISRRFEVQQEGP